MYIWNEVLAEDTTLLKGTKKSQIIRSKYKETTLEDEEKQ